MIIICTSMSCSNAPHVISFNHETKKKRTLNLTKSSPPIHTYFFATVPYAFYATEISFFKQKTKQKQPQHP